MEEVTCRLRGGFFLWKKLLAGYGEDSSYGRSYLQVAGRIFLWKKLLASCGEDSSYGRKWSVVSG
jgi:hypothetical protein